MSGSLVCLVALAHFWKHFAPLIYTYSATILHYCLFINEIILFEEKTVVDEDPIEEQTEVDEDPDNDEITATTNNKVN